MVSTMPLDQLCLMIRNLDGFTKEQLAAAAPQFRYRCGLD
jgi:hypothetical protein